MVDLLIKLLKGNTKKEENRSGDEIEVTYTIEIQGAKITGKSTKSGPSTYEAAGEAKTKAQERFLIQLPHFYGELKSDKLNSDLLAHLSEYADYLKE